MKKEQILLFILAAIQFAHIVDFMIMMPLGPQLMRLFEINPSQFGMLVSSYTFSAGIFGFAGAFFIDKFDRKTLLLYTFLGFTLGTFACAFAPNYVLLLSARIFTGAFGGVLGALVLSIVGDAIPHERRGRAMGIVMASFSVASVFGVPFSLYIASVWTWHAPFIFLGAIGVVISIFIWLYIPSMRAHMRDKSEARPHPLQVLKNVRDNKNQQWALLFTVLIMLSQFSIIPFLSPYMVANVGFSEMQLSYIYMFGGLATIFTSPWVGKLADKYGKMKIFTIFMILNAIPIIVITHMGITPLIYAFLISTFFFVTSNGRMIPSMALITSAVKPKNRGGFMSINSSVQQLASGLASFIAGLIIVESTSGELINYNLIGYGSIVLLVISLFVVRKLQVVDEEAIVDLNQEVPSQNTALEKSI